MKNKITIIAIIALSTICLMSCESYLDTKVDNNYGDSITWKLPNYALGVLNSAYANIANEPCNFSGNNYLDVTTDNAACNDLSSGLYQYVFGGQTPNSNPLENWDLAYKQFGFIHLFLENGLGKNIKYDLFNADIDKAIRQRSYGEAYFLRAWWGMELLQRYGGLTNDGEALGYFIVRRTLTDADKSNVEILKRNSYEECVKQIIQDCDTAIKYLPLVYAGTNSVVGETMRGRANQRSAYGLKSRVALLAASPAYQPSGSFAISTDSIQKKWKRAAIFSYQAITLGQLGAFAPLTNSILVGSGVKDVEFDEYLFRKWFNNSKIEDRNYPPQFFGNAKTNPSQNLVDAYSMKNGFPITDSRSGYNPQNPYINRDDRFLTTIYCNDQNFNTERNLEIFTYSNGVQGRDVAGADVQNTRTGYYLRKGMSTKVNMLYNPTNLQSNNDNHQNGLLRRAEMYFNLAEALNELVGPNGTISEVPSYTAYSIINDIRTKYGITSTTYIDEVAAQGQVSFFKLIMNERRLEFAFENMRFYDLRRRLLPLNENIKGVKITKQSDNTFLFEGTDPSMPSIIVESRNALTNKYIYSPLPYSEITKNKNLIQNKGW